MSSTSSYHLPQINNNNKGHASLPTTPKSSPSNGSSFKGSHFHYDPYNNFNRVFGSNNNNNNRSGSTTPRSTIATSTSSSRGHSRSVSHLQQQQQEQEQQYCYKNVSSHDNSSHDGDQEEENSSFVDHDEHQQLQQQQQQMVSGTCTPAVRMETEQQFKEQEFFDYNNNEQEQQEMMMVPKPRSSNHNNNNNNDEQNDFAMMEEQRKQGSTTLRATTRTMQHLLQNVPYLFLDTVAESTVLCRNPNHRVGQNIMAWSNNKTPAQLEREFPDRYQGQCIRDIFVAQLPFDLPLDAIQLVADLLIEGPRIHVLHAAPHIKQHKSYDGCSFVKMFENDAIRFINAMHKRVLFDVDGVWVATSTSELQELTDYCAWFQEQKHDQRKEILKMPTPFSAMTAEFALRGSRRATAGFFDNRPNQQQQQGNFYQEPQGYFHYPNNNNNQPRQPYTYQNAPAPVQASTAQSQYYNAVYDQNPHQRQVGNYFAQQKQTFSNYSSYPYNHHQQQGTYQQGTSFYPNQAQIQYLAPHQQRALLRASGMNNNSQ